MMKRLAIILALLISPAVAQQAPPHAHVPPPHAATRAPNSAPIDDNTRVIMALKAQRERAADAEASALIANAKLQAQVDELQAQIATLQAQIAAQAPPAK